ncbi:hypothetical protein KIPB_010865, partial [Kipferlia bialata]|eukprot:g10865.t1
MVQPDVPCYKLVPHPSFGMGMVATRDILQGEVILTETPLLYMPMEDVESESEILERLAELTEEEQAAFWALCDMDASEGVPKTACGVVNTNAFTSGVNSDHSATYRLISRFNHSCINNLNRNTHYEEGGK